MATLKKANECAKYLKNVGGEVGNEIVEKTIKHVKTVNEQKETPAKATLNDSNNINNSKIKDRNKKLNATNTTNNINNATPMQSPKTQLKTPKTTPTKETASSKTKKNKETSKNKLTSKENLYNHNNDEYGDHFNTKQLKDTSAQTIIYGSSNQKLIMLKQGSFESFSTQSDDEDELNSKVNGTRGSVGSKKKLSKKKSSGKLKTKSTNENENILIEPISNGSSNISANTKQQILNNDTSNCQVENLTSNVKLSETTNAERLRELDKKAKIESEREERDKRNEKRNKNLSVAYRTTVPILRLRNNNNNDEKFNSIKGSSVKKSNEENSHINNGISDDNDGSLFVSSPERTIKNENTNSRC